MTGELSGTEKGASGANTSVAATEDEQRLVEVLLRNITMLRDFGVDALESGEAPKDVLNRTLDHVEGFVKGTRAMVLPPDMVPKEELAEAVEMGRQLAKRYGW